MIFEHELRLVKHPNPSSIYAILLKSYPHHGQKCFGAIDEVQMKGGDFAASVEKRDRLLKQNLRRQFQLELNCTTHLLQLVRHMLIGRGELAIAFNERLEQLPLLHAQAQQQRCGLVELLLYSDGLAM